MCQPLSLSCFIAFRCVTAAVWESWVGFHSGELTLLVFALNYPSTHPHFSKIKLNRAKSGELTWPKSWITYVFPCMLALSYTSTTRGFADIPLRLTSVSNCSWSTSSLSCLDSRYTSWAKALLLSFFMLSNSSERHSACLHSSEMSQTRRPLKATLTGRFNRN